MFANRETGLSVSMFYFLFFFQNMVRPVKKHNTYLRMFMYFLISFVFISVLNTIHLKVPQSRRNTLSLRRVSCYDQYFGEVDFLVSPIIR